MGYEFDVSGDSTLKHIVFLISILFKVEFGAAFFDAQEDSRIKRKGIIIAIFYMSNHKPKPLV